MLAHLTSFHFTKARYNEAAFSSVALWSFPDGRSPIEAQVNGAQRS